jgi:hypothetical protein
LFAVVISDPEAERIVEQDLGAKLFAAARGSPTQPRAQ